VMNLPFQMRSRAIYGRGLSRLPINYLKKSRR
jgi:hypothetical protein